MDRKDTNETDVREEIATPLLSALGYQRGTENDILREFPISYDRMFLGRKKKNDPPLRGRPDYVLSVLGAGRWVLEIKPPSENIAQDAVEEAMSYARHPQIAASYSALLNGKRFVLFHYSQKSNDPPRIDLEVSSPADLAALLINVLSPSAIRRDCSPPIVDLEKPLATGIRSKAKVIGGAIRYTDFTWESSIAIPAQQMRELDEMCRRIRGFRADIISGHVWRDETSRIRARFDWSVPHDAILQFARDKKLMEVEYVALDEMVSGDPDNPTVFDVVGTINVSEGEALFDVLRWDTQIVGIAASVTYRGQASGHMKDNAFSGSFQAEYESTFPSLPLPFDLRLFLYALGTFEVVLDVR